jgi:rare lipoprotein A
MFRKILLSVALLASVSARAETVTASWYGPRFHGRRTASGCLYNQHALTAASRTLPMGTVIEVSRAGRSVVLVVNDRGPYVAHRRLDLSLAAAQTLDMVGLGVAPVRVRVIGYHALRC